MQMANLDKTRFGVSVHCGSFGMVVIGFGVGHNCVPMIWCCGRGLHRNLKETNI
jgi:hypothetical protein